MCNAEATKGRDRARVEKNLSKAHQAFTKYTTTHSAKPRDISRAEGGIMTTESLKVTCREKRIPPPLIYKPKNLEAKL